MRAVIQTVMCTIGTIGFSILFNVRGRKLVAAAAGAALSWTVYLIVYGIYEDKVFSLLCATVTIGILSEVLARVMKAPVIILLVPMLIPLFPGSDLYYTTSNLIQGNMKEGMENLSLVVREAGAIAFGIILVTCTVQVIMKLCLHFTRKIKTGI